MAIDTILILTEGGSKLGYGHVARCLALQDALIMTVRNIKMIVNGGYINNEKEIISRDWINELIQENEFPGNVAVIIDSYLITEDVIKFYTDAYPTIAFIDDSLSMNIERGIVINPTNFIKYLKPDLRADVQYIFGSEYILLKKELWAKQQFLVKESINRILVTMGGSDIRNISFLTDSFFSIFREFI